LGYSPVQGIQSLDQVAHSPPFRMEEQSKCRKDKPIRVDFAMIGGVPDEHRRRREGHSAMPQAGEQS
jgi:hypothetical protein